MVRYLQHGRVNMRVKMNHHSREPANARENGKEWEVNTLHNPSWLSRNRSALHAWSWMKFLFPQNQAVGRATYKNYILLSIKNIMNKYFCFFLLKSCWHIRIRNCSYNCKQSRSFMYYTAIFSDQYSYKNGVFGKVISFIYTACRYSQFIFDAVSKIFHSHTLYQCVQWNSISSNR